MSQKPSTALGDLLAPGSEFPASQRTEADGSPTTLDMQQAELILALFADHYGAGLNEIETALNGTTLTARILRDIIGLGKPLKRRGRPPKDLENWQMFVFITHEHRRGSSLTDAIDAYIEIVLQGENENATRHEATRKQFVRLSQRWSTADVPNGLAALFIEPPARRQARTKS